jgi:2-dehydropantoate 2-reductase
MRVLVIGAGVIGTVYGAQLAAAGHPVSVLRHGRRTDEVARLGLVARDVVDQTSQTAPVELAPEAGAGSYDLVLISVWATQLPAVIDDLRRLSGAPALLFFGNNPTGRAALPGDLPGTVHLGFPGIGGSMADGAAEYLRLPQQPTTLQTGGGPSVAQFEAVLHSRGFAVARTPEMDGWLAYHAVFVASVAAALSRCQGSAVELAAHRSTVRLMCRAIEEGFRALRRAGVQGVPRNLRTLHLPVLRPVAVRYWSRTMRSPMGERCFAAHARHARPEMRALASEVMNCLDDAPDTGHLRRLLAST